MSRCVLRRSNAPVFIDSRTARPGAGTSSELLAEQGNAGAACCFA